MVGGVLGSYAEKVCTGLQKKTEQRVQVHAYLEFDAEQTTLMLMLGGRVAGQQHRRLMM